VRHAESLLVWDSLSVLEVAAASGFGSVSRFYEAFTEVTGRRPREVRGQRGEFVAPKPPTPMLYALWVDDAPENNIRERRALNAIGFAVDCYVSTRQGLTALAHGGYALVISDVRRTGRSGTGDSAGSARHGSAIDEDTGWAFAEAVRRKYPRIPVLLYCGYDDPARRRRARDVGAAGLFTREAELLDAVRREFREGFPERRKPETDHD
jgi:CheY-like chemotaxis protein